MAKIVLKNIEKTYEGGVTVIKNLNLTVEDGEFLILVGPSGCGKSSTLRMISGLEPITGGELYIGDRLVNEVAPKDRDIAMVFQSYALYPHMTVYRNMSFALELRHIPKEEIERRVYEAARILDIEEYLDRKPRALSGGQRQRVALGRAMVRNPAVFLLDEPLSNLDAKLRTQMRAEITELHRRLGTTFVYVTHDQTEAMTMADRIVVMKDGVIQQTDTPENLYRHPKNTFVASFIGTPEMNILKGQLTHSEGRATLTVGPFHFPVPKRYRERIGREEGTVLVGIRPESFEIKGETVGDGFAEATLEVEHTEMMGAELYLYTRIGNKRVIARVESEERIGDGEDVPLLLAYEGVHLFDAVTEENLLV